MERSGLKYVEFSENQKGILVLSQMEEANAAYNLPGVMVLEGELDIPKLEKAFYIIIQRHESLRTSFIMNENGYVQVIHPGVDFKINYYDFSKYDKEEQKRKNRELIGSHLAEPFNLQRPPLLKVSLVQLEEQRHLLILIMHHIISDGWSLEILKNELVNFYDSLVKGSEIESEQLAFQYDDFVNWQKDWLETKGCQLQREYWQSQLEGVEPLDIPANTKREGIKSYKGKRKKIFIAGDLLQKVKEVTRQEKSTLFISLLTVFYILLHKYSDRDDIVITSPFASRNQQKWERIIGCFVNNIPLRVNVKGDYTLRQLLAEVKQTVFSAFKNQHYPYNLMIKDLGFFQGMSRFPISDISFGFDVVTPDSISNISSLKVTEYEHEDIVVPGEIMLFLIENNGVITGNLDYCTSIYSEEIINSMVKHFMRILDIYVNNREIKISEIELLTEAEKERLLYDFNPKPIEIPERTVTELFAEQVLKTPDKEAVVFGDYVLSYRELNAEANRIARFIRDKGGKNNSIVGVLLERSPDLLKTILGILKAGAAFLPIDPAYPDERISLMLNDSNALLLISKETTCKGRNIKFEREKVYIDKEELSRINGENLECINKLNDIAYVIYTSGSTGTPKGVMIEHDSIVNLHVFTREYLNISEGDRITQFYSCSFDPFIWEIFMALLNGATLYIVPQEIRNNYLTFQQFLDKNGITISLFPPAYLDEFPTGVKTLKKVIVGGSVLSWDLVTKWGEKVEFINAYGPTEATVNATTWRYEPGKERVYNSVPIGKPVCNTNIYIVNKYNQLQPMGLPGELCISGYGVGRGYLNRPELTGKKFIPDPFVPGRRMYKTGDLARWCPDGNIEFLGRIDEQVKIRGYRVELGEIEQVILGYGKVKACAVVDKLDQKENRYLVAYIVPQTTVSPEELSQYLVEKLPEYMIPSYFINIDELPSTISGKVDKNKLRARDDGEVRNRTYEPPQNEVEQMLVSIWQKVLGLEQIGVNDHFFQLGGTSLQAIQILSHLEREGYHLKINDIFKYQNIRQLAKYMAGLGHGKINDINKAESLLYDKFGDVCKYVKYIVEHDSYYVLYIEDSLYAKEGRKILAYIEDSFEEEIHPHYLRPLSQKPAIEGEEFIAGAKEFNQHLALKSGNWPELLKLKRKLGRLEKRFHKSICHSNAVKIYPLSPIQKGHLNMVNQYAGNLIRINRCIDQDKMIQAILKLIEVQSLLRSSVRKKDGGFAWYEHGFSENIPIPFIDLAGYEIGFGKQFEKAVLSLYFGRNYFSLGRLAYSIFLIKNNLREYTVVFPCSHSVFDAMSDEVIQRSLHTYYEKIKRNEPITSESGYDEYILQIKKGPQQISEAELIALFELEDYKRSLLALKKSLRKNKSLDCLEFSINAKEINLHRPWEFSFSLFVSLCARYFQMTKIPLQTIYYGRHYQNRYYFDLVGEFLDIVPLLIDTGQDIKAIISNTQEKIKQLPEFNINFVSLLFDPDLRSKYPDIGKMLLPDKDFFSTPLIIFNFEGEVKDFGQIYNILKINQERYRKFPYRLLLFHVVYTREMMKCFVVTNICQDLTRVETILAEETATACKKLESMEG